MKYDDGRREGMEGGGKGSREEGSKEEGRD